MKKSELRAIIAEIVKEELAKLEDSKVEEKPAAAENTDTEETKDEEEVVEESAEEEPEQTTEQLNESCEDAEDCAELKEAAYEDDFSDIDDEVYGDELYTGDVFDDLDRIYNKHFDKDGNLY